jgi:hypothetical protein
MRRCVREAYGDLIFSRDVGGALLLPITSLGGESVLLSLFPSLRFSVCKA